MNLLQLTIALREFVKEHNREKAFILTFEIVDGPTTLVDIPKFSDSNYGPGEVMEIFNDRFDINWLPSAGIMRFRVKENPIKKVLEKHLKVHYENVKSLIELSLNGTVDFIPDKGDSLLASIHNFSGVMKIYNGYLSFEQYDYDEMDVIKWSKEVDEIANKYYKISI